MSAPAPLHHLEHMGVSSGTALVCSAALHGLGLGLAGWATHAQDRQPGARIETRPVRAHAMQYLALSSPRRPESKADPGRSPGRRAQASRRGGLAPAPFLHRMPPSFQMRELVRHEVTSRVAAAPVTTHEPVPVSRGENRTATLVTTAGSACPELPAMGDGGSGEVTVAVAFVVDTSGRVDESAIRVVESPGLPPSDRGFYPRIYVVGARVARERERVARAAYATLVATTVSSHVAGLEFRPALRDGRPVSSAVLVACHRAAG
jgi:hypothetical protein